MLIEDTIGEDLLPSAPAVPPLQGYRRSGSLPAGFGDASGASLRHPPARAQDPVRARTKRALDLTLAVLGLVACAPLLLLAAIAIKLDSGGPILYRQRRVGFFGEPFVLLKLRSMYGGFQPASGEARWTDANDRRITRVGKVLRRYRIDELPQFWNVLRGEMSLVGPRPEQVPMAERLTSINSDYAIRHLVRPGITGLAQINNGYSATVNDSLTKLQYDLGYIRRMSLRLDLEIICRTVGVVLSGRGSR